MTVENIKDPMEDFFNALSKIPKIEQYWMKSTHSFLPYSLDEDLLILSSQEKTMAAFFANVWTRGDAYKLEGKGEGTRWGFNILDVPSLDPEFQKIITDWIKDPYWP